MNSCAIHLFIDAFPSGWMKTIMDVERQPKPSYFAYREALTPLMVNLRTDRFAFFGGEKMQFEAWICNDTPGVVPGARLAYRMEQDGAILACGATTAAVPQSASVCQGRMVFTAPKIAQRCTLTIRLALLDNAGKVLHDTSVDVDIFAQEPKPRGKRAWIVGPVSGKAATLARGLGMAAVFSGEIRAGDVILVDDLSAFRKVEKKISQAVKAGNLAVILELPEGDHDIAETRIKASTCEMAPYHFVSRDTGHEMVRDFKPLDFKFWCDDVTGYPSPLIDRTLEAPGWVPILKSGNGRNNVWGPTSAVAEKICGKGAWRVCQVLLGNHLQNPAAAIFARRLLMEQPNQKS
jgi:hypothetical protein